MRQNSACRSSEILHPFLLTTWDEALFVALLRFFSPFLLTELMTFNVLTLALTLSGLEWLNKHSSLALLLFFCLPLASRVCTNNATCPVLEVALNLHELGKHLFPGWWSCSTWWNQALLVGVQACWQLVKKMRCRVLSCNRGACCYQIILDLLHLSR